MILDLVDDAFRRVFSKTKLRIRVVMIEYVFDAEPPERQRNQENVVGRGYNPGLSAPNFASGRYTYVIAVSGQRQCLFPYPRQMARVRFQQGMRTFPCFDIVYYSPAVKDLYNPLSAHSIVACPQCRVGVLFTNHRE
jgi:hypothetical protein